MFSIRIPRLLSFLAFNRLEGAVPGIRDLQAQYQVRYGPGNYIPPVTISYWSFRFMVGAGVVMLVLAIWGLRAAVKDRLSGKRGFLAVMVWGLGLPYLANSTGWILTEMGRMPWVVYGVMRVEAGISRVVGPGQVWLSLVVFALLYGVLLVADMYLLRKYALRGAGARPVPNEP